MNNIAWLLIALYLLLGLNLALRYNYTSDSMKENICVFSMVVILGVPIMTGIIILAGIVEVHQWFIEKISEV